MITASLTKIASAIPPSARTRVHRVADRFLDPWSSVVSAARPTDLVALTFDDGPHPDVTPRMLDLLRDRGVSATFFVLTDLAIRHPELIRRAVSESHEMALHFDRHDRLTRMPRAELEARFAAAVRALEQIAGGPIKRFRPPYGAQGLPVIMAARKLGLEIIVWRPSAFEWEEETAEASAARLLDTVKGGDIALLHDGYAVPPGEPIPPMDRADLLARVLDGLETKGLRATSVEKLIEAAGARRTFWVRS
jgi:peptidoglycan/xylan/chitin deacetylase (PgdA/CDA1 family)